MAMTSDAPADTTMMRIVHDALRRDLDRARAALSESATPSASQRRAIAGHLVWMMQFLRAHHASEDEGLYPLVRDRAGDAVDVLDVLDRMHREHEAIATAIADVEAAVSPAAESTQVLRALDALVAVLLPHLREEEDEAMPIVSRFVTVAEWQAIEQAHNLDPKSMSELGFEGHWLIDGAAEDDRATVVGLVPPIPRFILLHGFARRYRRHANACWGATRPPRRVQTEAAVAVTAQADIDEVWDVVRDVTRVGEWSHECVGARWIGGATAATPGARFRGRNRAGVFRWGRICEVISSDPYEFVWRTVPTMLFPDSSEWRITLDRVDGATRIVQRFHVLRAPKLLSVVYAVLIPTHRDRTAALTHDLERLGMAAASHAVS